MSTNASNPDQSVPEALLEGWRTAIDSIAEMLDVPVVLIMRITGRRLDVFLASNTPNNPFRPGDSELLADSGLYCEAVIRDRAELQVPDSAASDQWRANPAAKLGMRAYLGYPLLWPNGRVFGTVCVLDRRPRTFADAQRRLVGNMRRLIEGQLSVLPPPTPTPRQRNPK